MLPADDDTKEIDKQKFQSLRTGKLPTLEVDYELGGIAVQDPSQGLMVQIWKAEIINSRYIVITSLDEGYSETWYESEINALTEVSLAFDQNMRPVIAFVENYESKLLYYDTASEEVEIENFGSDVRSPRASLDEKRQFYGNISDVIFSYIKGDSLYIRLQRDRYRDEYLIHEEVPEGYYIYKSGMTTGYRFQWEFRRDWTAEEKLETLLDSAPNAASKVTHHTVAQVEQLTADNYSTWGINPSYVAYALQDPVSGDYWADTNGNLLVHTVEVKWDE